MKRFTLLLIFLTLSIPVRTHSMTFQFDRTQPGVSEFVESYIRFSVNGKQLTTVIPPLFYLITESSEKETVVAVKVGNIRKNEALSTLLTDLVGTSPQTFTGLKGKPIFYNPMPSNMKLSAYTQWKEWLFIAGGPDAIAHLLKGASKPEVVVTPDAVFLSDGLPKKAPVRFWANNTNGRFSALIRETQPRSIIPLPKDPDTVKRVSGLLRLGPGRKVVATATAVPSKPKQRPALKKELEATLNASRQLLEIFKVPSSGIVKEKGKVLDLKLSVDDYLLGQPNLFKPALEPPAVS